MKKNVFLVMLLLSVCLFSGNVFADGNPVIKETPTLKVIVDGTQLSLKTTPINYNGRILLGLRELLIGLGVPNDIEHILWDKENKAIKFVKDDKEVFLSIGNKKATINGEEFELDTEPVIYKNSTYIPARFVAQSLSRLVFWDGATYSVIIAKEDMCNQVGKVMSSGERVNGPVRVVESSVLVIDGNETVRSTYDIKQDFEKNIEYMNLVEVVDGERTESEIYSDGTNVYTKSKIRNQWRKELQPDGDDSESTLRKAETDNGFVASLNVKETDSSQVILEGDSLALVIGSKGSAFDVLKDKTSKCHVKIEYKVTTIDVGINKYELKRVEYVTTGSYNTKNGVKQYNLTRTTDYMLDEVVTVPVPDDLNNSYTIPKGMNEYYNTNRGYSLYVPEAWYLPDSEDKTPIIAYENASDTNKSCGIVIEFVSMNYEWSLSGIKSEITKISKGTLNNSKITKSENVKWKGNEAIRLTLTGKNTTTGKSMKEQITYINYDGELLIITYIGEPTTYDSKYNEATKIIDSWIQIAFG